MKTIAILVLTVNLVGAASLGTKTSPATKGRLDAAGTKTSPVVSQDPDLGTKGRLDTDGTKTSPIVSPDPDVGTKGRLDGTKTVSNDDLDSGSDFEETRSVFGGNMGSSMASSNIHSVSSPYNFNTFGEPLPGLSRSVIQTPVDQPLVNPSTIVPKPIIAAPTAPKPIFSPLKPLATNQRSYGAVVQPDYSGGYYGMDANDYLGGWRSASNNYPIGWNGAVESVYIGSVLQQFGNRQPLLPAATVATTQPLFADQIKPVTRFYQPAVQTGFKPMVVTGQRSYANPLQLSPSALKPITYTNQGLVASPSAALRHECLYRHKC